MLKNLQDAYGHAIHESKQGKPVPEIVEREDGLITVSVGSSLYFSPFRRWPVHERKAIRYVRGRVLDIGCGAGRVLLHLQELGLDCVGIDISPLALKVCKERGARDVKPLGVTQISARLGHFDTIVMFGNNFGLMGSHRRAQWLLRRLAKITTPKARILVSTADPYETTEPEHLWYHRYNRKRGRMSGQLRLRVRYKKYTTPWFDYLLVSPGEMRDIVDGTGWHVKRIFESGSFLYGAIIEKC